MGVEDSWAADTVALRGQKSESRPKPPRRRASRLSATASGVAATCASALAVVTTLVAILSGGSDSSKAPIREIADPEPRIVVKQLTRMHRRDLRRVATLDLHPRATGQQKEEREAKAIAETHELAEPEPLAEVPLAPKPATKPSPVSPTAEFGL